MSSTHFERRRGRQSFASISELIGYLFWTKRAGNHLGRIVLWSEAKNIAECQAGFRQRRSTIDQISIPKTIVDDYLFRKKGRFYCMFVDFSKASDTINQDYLIYMLIKQGMHGKKVKFVREIYSKVKATVRTKDGVTNSGD